MSEPRSLADWLSAIEARHPTEIEMGLDRVGAVYARMDCGRPAARVITIAGTNGKGSTVAFVESVARAAGWRVGAYTSPHLLAYNERVRIDGVDVDDAALVEAFEAVEAARGDTPLTYFETGTLAALWLFARAELDLAVLEVGLGGRLDAVNIVEPDVAVITTVGLDHQDWLGNDVETIGLEKAGIARAWKPLIVGDTDPPASVLRHAYRIGAVAVRGGSDFLYAPTDSGTWNWREVGFEVELPMPTLAAPVQLRNAAVAIAAIRALDRDLDDAALAAGIAGATVAGRLQRFERDGVDVVVDVAHNPQAAQALADWLIAAPAAGRTVAVYAALADKDAPGVVGALAPSIAHWHLAGSTVAGARGQDAATLRARLSEVLDDDVTGHVDVATALSAALAEAAPGDRVLVFGTFHAAAAALQVLQGRR
ncbi:bifunctional tetrahydrofolate synthase/dihydrofolate synthase [Luteimonas fraxinea]|uniref:Dihydrofolate synthase/folylpolyglutamate synthase n=1 Tax=Luteimonas fraxinea TaxID=2901869 RepID=A0ABS8UB95_9GAMM|nr:bifunctional tetrahydrofolate synthase/dihydrofolate synthase [Luteimonas fraxinea]MCD9096026.1 bifunctional tetrahydrofolate synthase/dihydrofolate synthase [Luteimonas fraxinea]UHH10803.1 bifunctional tetrahydrofolate synthase/dihydrofolate synthase [Luteimonas fraxinea]